MRLCELRVVRGHGEAHERVPRRHCADLVGLLIKDFGQFVRFQGCAVASLLEMAPSCPHTMPDEVGGVQVTFPGRKNCPVGF